MKAKSENQICSDLPARGRALLQLIANRLADPPFVPGDPSTYLGYKECCVALGVAPPDADLPWGRLLQPHGLNNLNGWTLRHDFRRTIGLIVNQTDDRQYWPGGDDFASTGRPDIDGDWWQQRARGDAKIDWRPFL